MAILEGGDVVMSTGSDGEGNSQGGGMAISEGCSVTISEGGGVLTTELGQRVTVSDNDGAVSEDNAVVSEDAAIAEDVAVSEEEVAVSEADTAVSGDDAALSVYEVVISKGGGVVQCSALSPRASEDVSFSSPSSGIGSRGEVSRWTASWVSELLEKRVDGNRSEDESVVEVTGPPDGGGLHVRVK